MNCNHIVGTEHERFSPKQKPITHKEHLQRKESWRGEINWNCPLCGQELWKWVKVNDPRLGKVSIKKYVGR